MSDIHLDTSWCPVCDCAILPKRYTVPINPPAPQQPLPPSTSSNAVRSSQTTRGKNGTIKARAGGGLAQGTGRIRPGLYRAHTTQYAAAKGKSPVRQEQQEQQPVPPQQEPVRTRTVIDQNQTPLYCSEECRKRDLEQSWVVAPPSARAVLEADELRGTLAATGSATNIRLGAHPSQINPARASPPPPSPTLPPVPPNSFKAPRAVLMKSDDDSALDLSALKLRPYEDLHSDSSSATGSSFTASDRSPVDERLDKELFDNSNLYTDPAPPPLPDMPLHPHRPSAPVIQRGETKEKRSSITEWQGGFLTAARRISAMFATNSSNYETDSQRREKAAAEEKKRRERELRRKWFGDEVADKEEKLEEEERRRQEEAEKEKKVWAKKCQENLYNPWVDEPKASTSVFPAVPSTHRRASDNSTTVRAAYAGTPSRAQSALELYAKYPIFAGSNSNSRQNPCKFSASLATSSSTAFGISSKSSATSSRRSKRTASTDASTLPGAIDPEAYKGKRLAGTRPRRAIAEGLEGKLVLPDVLLRPIPPSSLGAQLASSLPNSGLAGRPSSSSGQMRRSESEANVVGRARGKAKRSTSALGSVREEAGPSTSVTADADEVKSEQGMWHKQEPSDTASSVSGSSASGARAHGRRRGSGGAGYGECLSHSTFSEDELLTSYS